jgi:hypothetical protein
MRSWGELQENRRVDWQISAYPEGPECSEATNGREVGSAAGDHPPAGRDIESKCESSPAAEDITTKIPEHSTRE